MHHLKSLLIVLSLCLLATALSPRLMADQDNERTTLTFAEPVEVPGMVLPAGTYVFELPQPGSDRSIVQIFDKDQTRLVATVLTVPAYRETPTGKTVVTFESRSPKAPEAIKAWFYPGQTLGQEFVYP